MIIIKVSDKMWFGGMTIFPFIFLKKKFLKNHIVLNHEKIHIEQQKEMLLLFFYILYLLEWLIKGIILKDLKPFGKGYKAISFEQEAYEYEKDLNYLSKRKRYNWTSQIFKLTY